MNTNRYIWWGIALVIVGTVLSTVGCSGLQTKKTAHEECNAELRASQESDAEACIAQMTSNDQMWLEKYCSSAIGDAMKYAYATHSKTFRIPSECSKFMTPAMGTPDKTGAK